jgi:isoleucyl-tRNA synthetase
MVPILDQSFETQLEAVKDLILGEVNVKELEYLKDSGGVLVKKIKPNFKALGPKYSKLMKQIAVGIGTMTAADITLFEQKGEFAIELNGQEIVLVPEDVEIVSEDIPGWLVANEGRITVALDITISDELREEGIARELVNRIQNLRKDSGLDVTDKIKLSIQKHDAINLAVEKHRGYIGAQTLATEINLVEKCNDSASVTVELESDIETAIFIEKL